MSMKPKEIHPEHRKQLKRISAACDKTATEPDVNLFLGKLHQIRLWINDLHNDIVKEEKPK